MKLNTQLVPIAFVPLVRRHYSVVEVALVDLLEEDLPCLVDFNIRLWNVNTEQKNTETVSIQTPFITKPKELSPVESNLRLIVIAD